MLPLAVVPQLCKFARCWFWEGVGNGCMGLARVTMAAVEGINGLVWCNRVLGGTGLWEERGTISSGVGFGTGLATVVDWLGLGYRMLWVLHQWEGLYAVGKSENGGSRGYQRATLVQQGFGRDREPFPFLCSSVHPFSFSAMPRAEIGSLRCMTSINLGCTVRTRNAVNVGRAGAKSAVNTTEVSIKCRDCQRGDSRQFGTFLT